MRCRGEKLNQTRKAGGTGKVGGTGGMGQADRALTAGRTERRRPVGQAGHRGDKQEDRLGRVVSSLAPMQGCASSFSAAATFTPPLPIACL